MSHKWTSGSSTSVLTFQEKDSKVHAMNFIGKPSHVEKLLLVLSCLHTIFLRVQSSKPSLVHVSWLHQRHPASCLHFTSVVPSPVSWDTINTGPGTQGPEDQGSGGPGVCCTFMSS